MAGSTTSQSTEFRLTRGLPSFAGIDVKTGGTIVGSLALMLVIWEAAVRLLSVRPILLPAPSLVARTLWERWDLIVVENTWPTIVQTIAGFGAAVIVGVAIGLAVTYSALIRNMLYPLIVATQTMPKVALAPLFIIWLGMGDVSRIALAFFVAFFPMVINTAAGLESVDDGLVRMARSFCGSRWKIFYLVRFPAALPYLFAGMKISITLAIIGVIVAEFVTSQKGLGYLVVMSQGLLDTPLMMAALVVLSVAGLVLFGVIALLERWVIFWAAEEH